MAESSGLELRRPDAADNYYNLLVDGFRVGQLSVKKEVPPELARLADPYDPAGHFRYQGPPYRLGDLSYYKGRLYLYFGVTPALLLFWPYVALTGHYLLHKQAVTIFFSLGFLVSVGLLRALWRRYFNDVSIGVVAACALALGLATGVPMLLWRSDVYEVAISCGYLLTMLALAAIWCALHEPQRRGRWLAVAGVAYGLAVGARPSLLFGAVILLVPVVQAWHERRQAWAVLLVATGPIVLIGLGLMLYNFQRFDNPFEFGERYQLNIERQVTRQFFSLRYLWFNFRVYFLEPAHWSAYFPFVQDISVPPVPVGYGQVRNPFGVLTNIPVVWLALAAPLAWRNRSAEVGSVLRWFVAAAALLFGMCALTLGLFCGANIRYEVDFLPSLLLLAVIGILGLERALSNRPVWRWVARCGWGLLLVFSVAFNLLATVDRYVEAHCNLGIELVRRGMVTEGIEQYEQALWIKPDDLMAHENLGIALAQEGKNEAAREHFERVVDIKPDHAGAHYDLGLALARLGRTEEAVEHWEQAVRIIPEFAEAHCNLGVALAQTGKTQEAIEHFEQALRIKPDYAEAHFNLGLTQARTGRVTEAIGHYEEALRIRPDYAEARNALAQLRAGR